MYILLGPLRLDNIIGLNWSIRRNNSIVSIPFGVPRLESITTSLLDYEISGDIFDNQTDPRLLRKQLQDLFSNHTWQFVYIYFSEDSNELSGWFLLDSFSTNIIPGTFYYSFSMNVRKLSAEKGLLFGLYLNDDIPLNTTYNLTPATRRWASLANGQGGTVHNLRSGSTGSSRVVIDTNVHYITYTSPTDSNDFRCRIFDTLEKRSLLAENNNDVDSNWEERFFVNRSFEGDIVISNGLIRIIYSYTNVVNPVGIYYYELWTGSVWERFFYEFVNITSYNSLSQPPIITYFDEYKIEFIAWHYVEYPGAPYSFGVKNTLYFGTYFIKKSLVLRAGTLPTIRLQNSGWASADNVLDNNYINNNYSSLQFTSFSGVSVLIGFLFTEQPANVVSDGGQALVSTVNIPKGDRYEYGVFLIPNPPPVGSSLVNLGREFLSDSNSKKVLIDPEYT